MRISRNSFLVLLSASLLSACTGNVRPEPRDVSGIPKGSYAQSSDMSKIRYAAIQETATSFGAQSGLAYASRAINKASEDNERHLNEVFNFNMLLLNNNVLPPVLSEGRGALDIDGTDALRLADKVYKIESPPRFVTSPPSWREYIWMNYTPPDKPNENLLPKTKEESKVWDRYYKQGWKDGVLQANQIFSENMGRLKRDYSGMILYRTLLNQGIVTAPFVAKSSLGVTGDSNEIRVNDQVLRITATSQLVTNSKAWKPVVVPGTDGAVKKQGSDGTETVED